MISAGRATLFKAARLLSVSKGSALPAVRNSHAVAYRCSVAHPYPKWVINTAEGLGALAWWWVLWHLWTEPGHITGEFPYPDPSKWTDEELGVTD